MNMKHYLKVEIESSTTEVIMRVEPIYCSLDNRSHKIKQDPYVPSKGDKLYFLPGVNVPRVKLKDLTMQYGIKSVRNIDEATHVFAGRNTFPKMVTHNWMYRIPTADFVKMFEASEQAMDEYYIENIKSALEFYNEDFVLCNYSTAAEIRNTENQFLQSVVTDELIEFVSDSQPTYVVDDQFKHYFPKVLHIDIIDEAQLLKHINGQDAVVIDEAMFEQLSNMFKSSDNDNHILAMEIMANSNYIDSLLYIELLFKEYSGVMGSCPTKNHVNFKSLIGFLGKNKNYMSTRIDDVMASLIRKNVLTPEMVDIILNKYSSEIEHGGNTTYFQVKTVTLNEEALSFLNTNYTYNLVEDVATEVEEVPEETFPDIPLNLEIEDAVVDDVIEHSIPDVEVDEVEEELLASEEPISVSESELNKIPVYLEEQSNNNQIEETNGGDGFEWF